MLVDKSTPLRTMARARLNQPELFWKKMLSHPPVRKPIPTAVTRAIRQSLPDRGIQLTFLHRLAGLGSLGKERFTGIGNWLGGQIAREAKALTVSACHWAEGRKDTGEIYYELNLAPRGSLSRSVRARAWRMAAPAAFARLLSHPPFEPAQETRRTKTSLLHGLGNREHPPREREGRSTPRAPVKNHKPADWLHTAAKLMRDQTTSDWKHWVKKSIRIPQ